MGILFCMDCCCQSLKGIVLQGKRVLVVDQLLADVLFQSYVILRCQVMIHHYASATRHRQ